MKKYDLTNKEVLSEVLSSTGGIVYPLIRYAFDRLLASEATKTQSKAASELIRQGKEKGVDEMEITMNNTKGFKLNVPLDDVNIDTILGSDEKMTIKVKYK